MNKTTRRGFIGTLACLAAWRPVKRPMSMGATYYEIEQGKNNPKLLVARDYHGKWVWVQHERKERPCK